MLVIRHLCVLGSLSAGIIVQPDLTKPCRKAAVAMLGNGRPAGGTLAKILRGARFKFFLNGILVSTVCLNNHKGKECGSIDSFLHLLRRYGLLKKLRTGVEPIYFLLPAARRPIPPLPRRARPFHIEP